MAFRTCERPSECQTTEWLSDYVLDSGPFSRECALPPDRGGEPGGVAVTTLSEHHFRGPETRPSGRVATSSPGVPGWESMRRGSWPLSPTGQRPAAMPPDALAVCYASTPCGVNHQSPHDHSSSMSSPGGDSTPSICSAQIRAKGGLAPGKETSATSRPGSILSATSAMSTTTRSPSCARFGTGLHHWRSHHRSLMSSLAIWGEFVRRRINRSRFATPAATMGPSRRAWSRSEPMERLPPIGTLPVRRARLPFPRSTLAPYGRGDYSLSSW